jgi:CRISPR type III-B/RAMP module RAMP protein Cmr1
MQDEHVNITEEVRNLTAKTKTLAVLEFVNYTPLWPGGPLNAKTYMRGSQGYLGPFLPDTKQLIGRLRWLLRTIEASLKCAKGSQISYKDVEGLASSLFGGAEEAYRIRVRLEYLSRGEPYISLDDLKLLESAFQTISEIRIKQSSFIEYMEVKGYTLLRRDLNLNEQPLLKGKVRGRYNKITVHKGISSIIQRINQEIFKLFTIPRVRFVLQGATSASDLYELQPLRANTVKMRVTVYESSRTNLDLEEKKLVVLSVPFLLTFIGLGKATSRGFGRFKLVDYKDLDEELEGIRQELDLLKDLKTVEDYEKAFRKVGKKLIELAASKSKGEPVDVKKLISTCKPGRIPSLAIAIREAFIVKELKHPCPYATPELTQVSPSSQTGCIYGKKPVRDILAALSAVGKAALKSTWKLGHRMLRDPGVAFHTWALGLPRSVSKGLPKGYYLLPENNAVIRDRYYTPPQKPPKGKEPRRLSPIVFTVDCTGSECFALVEPFITHHDLENVIRQLFHYGVHGKGTVHVVSVEYAATTRQLSLGDKGGIATPSNKPGTITASQGMVVQKVTEAALEWIKFLLK